MADPFGRLAKGLVQGRELRRQGQNDRLDQALKQAQLQEAGYSWDGSQLMQQPGYQSAKALERRKLENELEMQDLQKKNMRSFGEGSTAGGSQLKFGASSNSPLTIDPMSGKTIRNPAYLNPVQQKQLEALDAKQQAEQEAEQNKVNMLRDQATGQLKAIQEAKKGKKYFGMMGNVPSQFAPSTLFGEYGPRKEWENNVNKLLSGRVLDTLNQLKSTSKTGATGFGSLTQKELEILQQASNVLSKDLPPDLAEKYLNELEPIYTRVLGAEGQVQQQFGQPVQQPDQGGGQMPSFASESDIPPTFKGPAIVAGRKAVIE